MLENALMTQHDSEAVDMVLVGAGIMSVTLAVLRKELDPHIKLEIADLLTVLQRARVRNTVWPTAAVHY